MNKSISLLKELCKNLEWVRFNLSTEDFIYFFPQSLTLIEYDNNLNRLLTDLKHIEEFHIAEERLSKFYPENYVKDNLDNLQLLMERGFFDTFYPAKNSAPMTFQRIILANTLKCNMACTYCYNKFESNLWNSCEKDMSVKTFNHITSFLEKHGKGINRFELLFIGGEPFMKIDILKEAVKWRQKLLKKNRDVLIIPTTNATLITEEIIKFCMDYGIYLKITLDGDKIEHDTNRIFPDGTGSYERINELLPDFFFLYDNPFKYVTTTIDTLKSEPVNRVILLSAMGFNVIELTEFYSVKEELLYDEKELLEIYREKYRKLFDFLFLRMRSRNYLHIIPVYDIIKKLHIRIPNPFPCRSGIDTIAVSPDGTIYPCHHFYGDTRFALGSVYDKKFDSKKLKPYRTFIGEKEECSSCWARFLCGGPCYHRSLAVTGDAFKLYLKDCIRKKALYSEAILFYIKLKNIDPAAIDWLLQCGLSSCS